MPKDDIFNMKPSLINPKKDKNIESKTILFLEFTYQVL